MTQFGSGEQWKKVFGPVFIYLNSVADKNDALSLWYDAKEQVYHQGIKAYFCTYNDLFVNTCVLLYISYFRCTKKSTVGLIVSRVQKIFQKLTKEVPSVVDY